MSYTIPDLIDLRTLRVGFDLPHPDRWVVCPGCSRYLPQQRGLLAFSFSCPACAREFIVSFDADRTSLFYSSADIHRLPFQNDRGFWISHGRPMFFTTALFPATCRICRGLVVYYASPEPAAGPVVGPSTIYLRVVCKGACRWSLCVDASGSRLDEIGFDFQPGNLLRTLDGVLVLSKHARTSAAQIS